VTDRTGSEEAGDGAPTGAGSSEATRGVVESLYRAYLAGDPEGMLALLAEDVSVRFLAQADVRGIEEARRFFAFSQGLLRDVDFVIEEVVVDGEWAAAIWRETATTVSGEPWSNHGVDVIRVRDGKVAVLHENNDVRLVTRFFPAYPSP